MVNALGYDFVGLSARAWPPRTRSEHDQRFGHNLVIFQPMLGRRNIRPPHFASKVSYSAGAENAEYGAGAANAGYSVALQSFPLRLYPIFRAGKKNGWAPRGVQPLILECIRNYFTITFLPFTM